MAEPLPDPGWQGHVSWWRRAACQRIGHHWDNVTARTLTCEPSRCQRCGRWATVHAHTNCVHGTPGQRTIP